MSSKARWPFYKTLIAAMVNSSSKYEVSVLILSIAGYRNTNSVEFLMMEDYNQNMDKSNKSAEARQRNIGAKCPNCPLRGYTSGGHK
uniref:Uncharacterized protein n=1 Tax=Salix viminalis TaxID=40686 RepID=A0A6N2MEX9_SALVM